MSQRMDALERGNVIRSEMARLKRELRSLSHRDGLLRCAEVLENPPEHIDAMRFGQLLGTVRRVGPQTIGMVLASQGVQTGVSHWRLRDLDQGKRELLAEAVRDLA